MAAYAASILYTVYVCINISCPVLEYLSHRNIFLTAKTRREVIRIVNYTFE
jgi:hypothetical protein